MASALRAQGIDAGRRYVRYAEGEFRELEPEPERAASLLGQLDDRALRAFDRETAAGTRETAEAYGERTGAG